MQADHETISKTLFLYAKYIKIMDIQNRPIIVFTKQEYYQLIDKQQIRKTETRLNHRLGECKYGKNGSNDIIFIHTDKMEKLYGKETFSEPFKVKKRVYTYTCRKKIGTIEHTLIHELLHSKHRTLRHGRKFEDMIDYYYRQGNK